MITIAPHIQGLIFDSDGTLVDTMPLHYQAWQEITEKEGTHIPEQLFYDLAGVPSDRITEILNEKYGYNMDPQQITVEKEQLFLEKYLPKATPIEPVVAIAKKYKGKMPMAVATGGIPPVVNFALKTIGMEDYFDTVVTSKDVEHGKPSPDTFLEAARRLNVEPQYCIVFEDSDMGIEAAKRAGMEAVDIRPWIRK